MVDNASYGVLAIMGLVFMAISVGIAVDIAIIMYTIAMWNTPWVIPMGLLFLGWNMMWILGLAYWMNFGR